MRGLLITLGCVFAYFLIGLVAARALRIFELHNPKHKGRPCDDEKCVPYYVGLWFGPIVLVILTLIGIFGTYGRLGQWVYERPTWTQRRRLRKERREEEAERQAQRWKVIADELERKYPAVGPQADWRMCDHGEHGCTPTCLKAFPPPMDPEPYR